MTDNLTAWLHEQFNAAEASTRTLLYWSQQTILTLKDPQLLGKYIPGWHDWPDVEKMCQQRLADLDAKRRIVNWHDVQRDDRTPWGDPVQICRCGYDLPCSTVRLLALPHAGQPGYQERWRP